MLEAILLSIGLLGKKRDGGIAMEDKPAPKKARLTKLQEEAAAQVEKGRSDDGKDDKAAKADDAEVQVEI